MRFLSSIASCHRSSLKRDVNCSVFPCHFLLYKLAQNDVKTKMFRCSVMRVSLFRCTNMLQMLLSSWSSSIHSFIHPFTHSPAFIYPSVYSFIYSLIHSFIRSCIDIFINPFIHTCNYIYIHHSGCLYIHPFKCLYIHMKPFLVIV